MIRTTQIADAFAIVKAWEIVPVADRDWFDQILRAASIARTDEVLLRHDFSLTIGIRIRHSCDGTGPDMAWFFEACAALRDLNVKGADRLYRVFDETLFHLPCSPDCDGFSSSIGTDAHTYCAVGKEWADHLS